ncbi:HAMP domain-containing protein [Halalkalibacter krulwichiae]|nr:HAMP domain-containing protein [Halalkalibacter krulwichiae]
MSFRNKILIVLLLITGILSSFAFIIIRSIDQVNQVSVEINHNNVPELIWITHWENELKAKEYIVESFIENDYCCDLVETYFSFETGSLEELEHSFEHVPPSLVSINRQIELLDFMILSYVSGLIQYSDQTALENYLNNEYMAKLHEVRGLIENSKQTTFQTLHQHSNNLSVIIKESLWLLLLLTISSVSISIFLAYQLSKNLTKPIEQMVTKVDHIANGNYGLTVDHPNQVELQLLTSSINKMSKGLKDSFQTIINDKVFREQIVNSLPIGIITFDDRFEDVSLNNLAKKVLGSKKEFTFLLNEADNPNKRFWEILRSKELIHNEKVPFYSLAGEEKYFLISQSELLNQDQLGIGRIFYFIDITENEDLEKRTHQSEKLALV